MRCVLLLLTLFLVTGPTLAAATTIGLVTDGDRELDARLADAVTAALRDLLDDPVILQSNGDGTPEGAPVALEAALADPAIDLVIAAGYHVSHAALRLDAVGKPLVAPFALDAGPAAGEGPDNLSALSAPGALARHIDRFREVTPTRRLALVAPPAMLTGTTVAAELTRARPDLAVFLVPVAQDAAPSAIVAAVPAAADAVLVLPLGLSDTDLRDLAVGLRDRGLPAFSFLGDADVARGFLAGLDTDVRLDRLARRTALHVRRIMAGEIPGTLPTAVSLDGALHLNVNVARALGLTLDRDVLLDAVLENDDSSGPVLALAAAMQEALAVNRDLRAGDAAVAAGEQSVARAWSVLLPQAEVGTVGLVIDEDRADASFGTQAEQSVIARAGVTQVIYSDKARAGVAIQKHVQEARVRELDGRRLDVALETGLAWLNVERAGTLASIRRRDLRRTRTHLDMARVRETLGDAEPAEVLRWQAETASRRDDLVRAESRLSLARMELNRLLDRPLDAPLNVQADIDTMLAADWLHDTLAAGHDLTELHARLREESRRGAPELAALREGLAAQERAYSAAGRAYWLPTVALHGEVGRLLVREGAGADPASITVPMLGTLTFDQPDDTDWSVSLSASLPLFEGGARKADRLEARRNMTLYRERLAAAEARIDLRAGAALENAAAAAAGIGHRREAAAAAEEGLAIMTDAYGVGAVGVLDLLDAQTRAANAAAAAADAVHDYLAQSLRVQRATGRFLILSAKETE